MWYRPVGHARSDGADNDSQYNRDAVPIRHSRGFMRFADVVILPLVMVAFTVLYRLNRGDDDFES